MVPLTGHRSDAAEETDVVSIDAAKHQAQADCFAAEAKRSSALTKQDVACTGQALSSTAGNTEGRFNLLEGGAQDWGILWEYSGGVSGTIGGFVPNIQFMVPTESLQDFLVVDPSLLPTVT